VGRTVKIDTNVNEDFVELGNTNSSISPAAVTTI
jgi:hypothetical protein